MRETTLGLLLSVALAAAAQTEPCPPLPTADRVAWQQLETYAFVHFGLNTFTDREWGYGDTPLQCFNPTDLDCEQWVQTFVAAGLKAVILTAKHHDGFCLWPTQYTDYSVRNTPFRQGRGDVLGELAAACRKHGLRLGVYLSPWDRHQAFYGTPLYPLYYRLQMEELLTRYGDIFEVWLDGANGGDGWYGGAKERRKIGGNYYRFPEVFSFVRELQPKVCIFAGESDTSDFRWPGNEKGELDPDSSATICSTGGYVDGKYGNPDYKSHINTGMHFSENDCTWSYFRVCECDFPLRPGWFYHAKEKGKTKSGLYLLRRYLNTVGNGGTMNVGIAPNKDGLLDDEDVKALADFGRLKASFFSKPITNGLCNVVVMSEDVIARGEACDEWWLFDGKEKLAHGKTIGIKRIRTLERPRRAENLQLEVDGDPVNGVDAKALPMKFYYVEPDFLKAVLSAATESGETDTAKWMTSSGQ